MEANAITNAFTVDVEDYFHVSAYAGVIDREQWAALPSRVARNTDRIIELLADADVRGTFFVLGWVAQRHPEVVRRIVAAGHEVACHGLTHDLVYRQGRDKFRAETSRAKALIEDAAGTAVSGYRAASFSITRASLWALDCLAELGFRYDSSIFPVLHDRYGIPDAPRQPFEYRTAAGHSIVEFPMATVSVGRWRIPVGGGGYFRIYPYAVTRTALRRINRRDGRPFVFYTHPWEVDPDQPTFDAGRLSNFRHRANLARCHRRLRRLLADFRFAPLGRVLEGLPTQTLQSRDLGAVQAPAMATELSG
jgi:polysaccharide deacetylase family protein (PEP-CTERM system associated)